MVPSLGGAFPVLIGLEGEKEKKKKGRPDADLPSCFDCIMEDNIFEQPMSTFLTRKLVRVPVHSRLPRQLNVRTLLQRNQS
jgi:hypothetical protein